MVVDRRVIRRFLLLATLAFAGLLAGAEGASADTATVSGSPGVPWTDPAHQSQIEVLSGLIASQIAGRPVTVRCESDAEWSSMVSQRGGDPNAEAGYVGSTWNSDSGQLVGVSSVIELAGSGVCAALQSFAAATTKPTKCAIASAAFVPVTVERVPVRRTLRIAGKLSMRTTWVVRRVQSIAGNQLRQQFTPCYLGGGTTARQMPSSFWSDYERYAAAIVTLAHESIHAGGVVGGLLSNGVSVGDPQAEAKAECYGMQWMPFVAEHLGDSPDDAQAIATYFWDAVYPSERTSAYPAYWTPDCHPLGALDIHVPGATSTWP